MLWHLIFQNSNLVDRWESGNVATGRHLHKPLHNDFQSRNLLEINYFKKIKGSTADFAGWVILSDE